MSENSKHEIAVAEAIFQIEDPEGFAEYRRRIDTKDLRGVAVIIVDDEATGREELEA